MPRLGVDGLGFEEYYLIIASSGIMQATLLVTGGAGFIGSNFIRKALKAHPGISIVCLDSLTYAGNQASIRDLVDNTNFELVVGDVTDKETVINTCERVRPSHVIHFAAESHVDRSIRGGATLFSHVNVCGTTVLLQALLNKPYLKKYVQVSTDEVYGSLELEEKDMFTEESPLKPTRRMQPQKQQPI